MAADSEIIKSFLVELGFKIDEAGAKKFRTGLSDTTKGALALGGAVVGVGLAIEKFVEQMTEGLAKLYYASQISGSTVAGLKSTAAGFEAIGLSAEDAQRSVMSVGAALRQPWLKEYLGNFFGINTNQSTEKVTNELEHKLAGMFNQGGVQQRIAVGAGKEFLGLDEDKMATLAKFIDQVDKRTEDYNQRLREGGVDLEANAKASAEFQRNLSLVGKDFEVLGNEVLPKLLPTMNTFVNDFESFLHDVIKMNANMPQQTGFWKRLWQGMTGKAITEVEPAEDQTVSTGDKLLDEYYRANPGKDPRKQAHLLSTDQLHVAAAQAAAQFGLKQDLFQGEVQQESGFNPNAKNPKSTARGIAQIVEGTAKEWGIEAGKNPVADLFEMAKRIRELMDKHHLTQEGAMQWYNQGTSSGPQSAQAQMDAMQYVADSYKRMEEMRMKGQLASVQDAKSTGAGGDRVVNHGDTHITVNGSSDPHETATVLSKVMDNQNATTTRNTLSVLAN